MINAYGANKRANASRPNCHRNSYNRCKHYHPVTPLSSHRFHHRGHTNDERAITFEQPSSPVLPLSSHLALVEEGESPPAPFSVPVVSADTRFLLSHGD